MDDGRRTFGHPPRHPSTRRNRRSYEQLVGGSADYQLAGLRVRVASLDDIIASKEWANRPKDHAALPELHRLTARHSPPSLEPEDRPPLRADPEPPDLDLGL